jgi:hypothetical protein
MVEGIGTAGKAGAELFKEAAKQLQNANEQVSKFEELRQKLESQELTIQKPGVENMQAQQSQAASANQQVNQVNAAGQAQNINEIPKVTDMEGLGKVVDRLKKGQGRLKELLDHAMSGKTFSPQELLAVQTEVAQITTEIGLCSKIVEQGVSSFKSTMQMQV